MWFKKILVSNRGEIAVRVIRTCRELGIPTLALFVPADKGSLHMRLADECVQLAGPLGYQDEELVLQIARERKVDAVHPGYGCLAEQPDFIRKLSRAGITWIGPPAGVIARTTNKLNALVEARAAGFRTVEFSPHILGSRGSLSCEEERLLCTEAERLEYPVVIKSIWGGRGRGERLVFSPDRLFMALASVQARAQARYGDGRVYLEKAIVPSYQVGVPVLGDRQGSLIHLGEHEGLAQQDNRKIVEELPAPCLTDGTRDRLWEQALQLARFFDYQNVGTIEFLVDREGRAYFTEIKASLRPEHPLVEMAAQLDLVQEQIWLAAGEPLSRQQADVYTRGWAALCRIYAQTGCDSQGISQYLEMIHPPSGPHVRTDTYLSEHAELPKGCDPLVAKFTAWGSDRQTCVQRLRRAVSEVTFAGLPTNLALVKYILDSDAFASGNYDTLSLCRRMANDPDPETCYRDLAVAASVLYALRSRYEYPTLPSRLLSRWHRDLRIPFHWLYAGLNNGQDIRNN